MNPDQEMVVEEAEETEAAAAIAAVEEAELREQEEEGVTDIPDDFLLKTLLIRYFGLKGDSKLPKIVHFTDDHPQSETHALFLRSRGVLVNLNGGNLPSLASSSIFSCVGGEGDDDLMDATPTTPTLLIPTPSIASEAAGEVSLFGGENDRRESGGEEGNKEGEEEESEEGENSEEEMIAESFLVEEEETDDEIKGREADDSLLMQEEDSGGGEVGGSVGGEDEEMGEEKELSSGENEGEAKRRDQKKVLFISKYCLGLFSPWRTREDFVEPSSVLGEGEGEEDDRDSCLKWKEKFVGWYNSATADSRFGRHILDHKEAYHEAMQMGIDLARKRQQQQEENESAAAAAGLVAGDLPPEALDEDPLVAIEMEDDILNGL
jgi:hypothetical protein